MFRKLLIGAVMAVAMLVEMPFMVSAATNMSSTALNKPQIRIQIGRNRRWRRYHDRYDNDYYRRNRIVTYRIVPQYYWMDGVRYVRYVRVPVYYNNY